MIALTLSEALDIAIERMVYVLSTHRGLARARVIDDLDRGDAKFAHGLTAIAEMFSLPRQEINARVTAFIEAEKEEEAHRAIAAALAMEAET